MNRARLLIGVASALAGTSVLLAVLGVVYNPLFLFLAIPFGAGTYIMWADATGRIAARNRERARAARRRTSARGGSERRPGAAGAKRRRRVADGVGQRSTRGEASGRRSAPTVDDGPSAEEARRVLGVGADADAAEIKRAYREQAKELHPDQAGGDEEAFKRATEAYERLAEE